MDTSAFNRLCRDFCRTPAEKWSARLSSIGVALTYLLLLVLLYFFIDLLVWQGRVPQFAALSPARQREFASEWANRSESDRMEAAGRVSSHPDDVKRIAGTDVEPAPTPQEWEERWQAGSYLTIRDRVGRTAADAYLPETAHDNGGQRPRVGILSLVIRERPWAGRAIGWLASWNSWTWRPGSDGINLPYLTGLFILAFSLALIRGVLMNALTYLAAAVTLDFVTRLRRSVYLHTYRLGSLAVRTIGSAEATDLFTRQVDLVGSAAHASLRTTYRCPILLIGLAVIILVLHFWLAVSFLLLAALVWLIVGQVAAHFRREARLGTRLADSSLGLLIESLGLLHLVKSYQMERFNQNRVERQLAESGRAGWRKLRGDALAGPLLGSVALIAGVALLFLAGRSVMAEEFTVAGLTVMAVALVSLAAPVSDLVEARLKMRRGRNAAEAIIEFLERRGEAPEAADAEYLPALTSRVEFRGGHAARARHRPQSAGERDLRRPGRFARGYRRLRSDREAIARLPASALP